MSEFYVKSFNKKNRKKSTLKVGKKVFSLCKDHLDKCRQRWYDFSTERREQGLCCYCDNKSYNGYLRCRAHTAYNMATCKAWYHKHKEERSQYSKNFKNFFLDQGLCPQCKVHAPLTDGFKRCLGCRVEARAERKPSSTGRKAQ